MPTISSTRQIVTYTGPRLLLADAPFLPFIHRVFRLNTQGNFAAFVPGSNFNSFGYLEPGEGYILHSLAGSVPYLIEDGQTGGGESAIPLRFSPLPNFSL